MYFEPSPGDFIGELCVALEPEHLFMVLAAFLNAYSKSSGLTLAPTSSAVSTICLLRSASETR